MSRLLLVLVSSLPAVASLAQTPANSAGDELRGRAVGEIRNRKGEPWAGAEVVLLSRPLPSNPDIGEPDEVKATTDAEGRFHARILRGRPYTVWAWGTPGPEGRPATPVTENVFVQRPVIVREDRLLQTRRVALEGLDQWPGFAIELRVVDQTGNRRVLWIEVKDGAATLPFLLGSEAFVEALARKGEVRSPLARVRVAANAAGELRIELPERQSITCWARESGSGKPCAGAAVFRGLGGTRYAAGTTDAAGRLSLDAVKVEVPFDSPDFSTLVLGEGRMFGLCVQLRGALPAEDKLDLPQGVQLRDHFANTIPAEVQHVRVIGLGGRPVAGLTVLCCGESLSRPSHGGVACAAISYSFSTDARGQVAILGLAPHYRPSVYFVLRECDLAALPERWRAGLAPVVFAPLVGQPGKGSAEDPITVDLSSMCPVELRITGEDGTPAADVGMGFTLLAKDAWSLSPWGPDEVMADQLGRLRLLVPGRQHLGVRLVRGMSMLIRSFATNAGCDGDGPAVARFQLPPPGGVRGRVLERDGGPGRNRMVYARSQTEAPIEWDYASEPASVLDDAGHNRIRLLLPETEHGRKRLLSLIERQVATDDEGCFTLPLPLVPIPRLMLCTARFRSHHLVDSFPLDSRDAPRDDLEFRARL